ncbi:MAG: tRNA-guanine transglycosylase, partial [Nitrospiraceae bacterium]|nr:tRNA-guanine transglycosylase [Nitrospiraceae bacterium]
DSNCGCKMCSSFTRAYVHHLFKSREMLGYRILSYHNIFFFMRLMKSIREAIESHSFNDLYNKWMV